MDCNRRVFLKGASLAAVAGAATAVNGQDARSPSANAHYDVDVLVAGGGPDFHLEASLVVAAAQRSEKSAIGTFTSRVLLKSSIP